MLLRRASILGVLMLSTVGAVACTQFNSLLPQQAVAQNTNPPHRLERGIPRWIGKLNLSPDQMQRMQTIRDRYRTQMSQRAQSLRQAQQQLRQLMATAADSDQIRAQHNQVQTLHQQLAQLRFESMLEMRELLTPEQRRQLAERMQNRPQNFRHRDRQMGNLE